MTWFCHFYCYSSSLVDKRDWGKKEEKRGNKKRARVRERGVPNMLLASEDIKQKQNERTKGEGRMRERGREREIREACTRYE